MPNANLQSGDPSALFEAFRRRSGQLPSNAGLTPGASQNPLQAFAGRQAGASSPQPGLQPLESLSGPGRDQLQKSQPGERELIIKALIKVLRDTGPQPTPATAGA